MTNFNSGQFLISKQIFFLYKPCWIKLLYYMNRPSAGKLRDSQFGQEKKRRNFAIK